FALAIESIMRDKWVEPVLARNALFERINDIDRRRLAHAFKQIDLEPGTVLIEAGEEHDGAYMVRSGCMFFLHGETAEADDQLESSDGQMLSVLPGEMVHLGGLLRGFTSPYRVVAATPVQLLHLSRDVFEPFAMRRPWIIPAILKFSRRPAHLQVMQPEEAYLWSADRTISLRSEV
ncbi:MAG TPA: cyclic nucleotide-binding domain-containing protein, partial [Mariprofundaceae bacterium]|nr:cyclic nucleotide-binding domain-containing protein [Mariprofundaceae bacterium]